MSTTKLQHSKGYMTKELASLYQVSPKVFRNWLKPHIPSIGQRRGWYYTTAQVRIIFEKLGPPESLEVQML